MFWGGDTAQTINVGSAFRFEELKDMMYHEEVSALVLLRITPLLIYVGRASARLGRASDCCALNHVPITRQLPESRRHCRLRCFLD